jgi:hypothetical protein
MLNHLFLKRAAFAAGVFSILLCYILIPAETPGPAPVDRLHRLSEKIDSIEVEKQVQKRNGLPLSELDTKTANLRDSIQAIRLELGQRSAPQTVLVSRQKELFRERLKKFLSGPKNKVFDRILLYAGVIATLTGCFFIFLLLALKSRRRNKTGPQNQTKRMSAIYEEVQRKITAAQQIAYPDSFTPSALEPAAPASAIPPSVPPLAPEAASGTQERLPASTHHSDSDLKNLVLNAGKKGLDAKEISRRYQIGIDQVALILKMAKKQ